jgi:hypothetical protein
MIEALAMSLYVYAASIALAAPDAQAAAWRAQPAQMQTAFRREAEFLLSRPR